MPVRTSQWGCTAAHVDAGDAVDAIGHVAAEGGSRITPDRGRS